MIHRLYKTITSRSLDLFFLFTIRLNCESNMLCAFNECLLNKTKKIERFPCLPLFLLIIRGNEAHQVARTMFEARLHRFNRSSLSN